MKKFGKFLAVTFSLAAIIGGAYYVFQNYIKKEDGFDDSDDFDDFDDFDNFDDFDDLNEPIDSISKEDSSTQPTREYVTLDIGAEKEADAKETEEDDVKVFDLNSDVMKDAEEE